MQQQAPKRSTEEMRDEEIEYRNRFDREFKKKDTLSAARIGLDDLGIKLVVMKGKGQITQTQLTLANEARLSMMKILDEARAKNSTPYGSPKLT